MKINKQIIGCDQSEINEIINTTIINKIDDDKWEGISIILI